MWRSFLSSVTCGLLLCSAAKGLAADTAEREDVAAALRKAVGFFREKVSIEGGYLWRYSADLKAREGEGKATATQAWVQPPGAPSVGEALLQAHELTGDDYCLDAAKQTAHALVAGQLRSGGWDYRIEFDPALRKKFAYRADGEAANDKAQNTTTLDDNTTQAAVRFLMHIDRALDHKDAKIHEAVKYALESLLKAQYPNGAWPQRYSEFPNPAEFPVKKASYPQEWSRTFPKQDYKSYYTLNDNTLADVSETLFEAAEIYREPRYQQAAARAGDFLLLAQLPAPQPIWAQQYNADMQPAWARKFEPASVTGGESQGAIKLLMRIYRHTGDKKYLEPVPRALAHLQASQLPGGKLARFYELHTNKPLFFTKAYELTYSSDDMPTHYGFIVGSKVDSLQAEYKKLASAEWTKPRPDERSQTVKLTPQLTAEAKEIAAALDDRGAWVEKGSLRAAGNEDASATGVIDCRTFIKNVEVLSRFLAASKR